MQDYRQMYEEKKKTPEELAQYFKSGDVVGSVAALTEATTIMDALCGSDKSIATVPMAEPGEDDIKIAEFIAERIPDGACVQ